MKKEINYTLRLQDWPVTDSGSVKRVMTRELNLSRKEISRLKFDGEILLNGRSVKVNDHMRIGDTLTLRFPESETGPIPAVSMRPDILYEDEDVVVVNKPSGIVSHPVHGHLNDSMGTILAAHYAESGGDFVIRPIGRLDKDVSGVAVYGKNRPGAARLSRDLSEGRFQKHYTAFVGGVLETRAGMIDEPIEKEDGERRRVVGTEDGKPARTFYRVTHEFHVGDKSISVLAVEIDTGRTHQIRAHLASIGFPILGDELYGGDMSLIQRPALHCARADFLTPFTRLPVVVEAPIPNDMKNLLSASASEKENVLSQKPASENDSDNVPSAVKKEDSPPVRREAPVSMERTMIEEPAVMDEGTDRADRVKRTVGICLLVAAVIGGVILLFLGIQNRQRRKAAEAAEEAAIYEFLDIQFRDETTVEYGGDFRPEDYVVFANGTLTVNGTVDTMKLGYQEVVYILTTESTGGVQVKKDFTHTFTVKDTVGPEILLREKEIEIDLNQEYDLRQNVISAKDPVDGDVEFEIDESEFVNNTPGTYTVTVTASDQFGNRTEKTFQVTVKEKASLAAADKKEEKKTKTDASPAPSPTPAPSAAPSDVKAPVIELGSDKVTITVGDSFAAGTYISSVSDETDGALRYSEELKEGTYTVASNVDPNAAGSYEVSVTALDKAGNRASALMAVTVEEKKTESKAEDRTEEKTVHSVPDSSDPKRQIYEFLVNEMSFSHAQACGILANMHRESRFNPTADNGLGYFGLCQWGYERKDNLISWCEENGYDYKTIDGQLHFLKYEMPLFYPNTTAQLRAASDDEEGARRACWVFSIGYEVSGEEIAEMSKDKAVEYFNELA